MCINCLLCYAACPVYRLDPLFSGPPLSPWLSGITWIPVTKGPVIVRVYFRSTTASGSARSLASARRFLPTIRFFSTSATSTITTTPTPAITSSFMCPTRRIPAKIIAIAGNHDGRAVQIRRLLRRPDGNPPGVPAQFCSEGHRGAGRGGIDLPVSRAFIGCSIRRLPTSAASIPMRPRIQGSSRVRSLE